MNKSVIVGISCLVLIAPALTAQNIAACPGNSNPNEVLVGNDHTTNVMKTWIGEEFRALFPGDCWKFNTERDHDGQGGAGDQLPQNTLVTMKIETAAGLYEMDYVQCEPAATKNPMDPDPPSAYCPYGAANETWNDLFISYEPDGSLRIVSDPLKFTDITSGGFFDTSNAYMLCGWGGCAHVNHDLSFYLKLWKASWESPEDPEWGNPLGPEPSFDVMTRDQFCEDHGFPAFVTYTTHSEWNGGYAYYNGSIWTFFGGSGDFIVYDKITCLH